jgi:hypothetical protein
MRTEANTRGRRYPRAMALVGLVTIITAASLRLQADTGTCGGVSTTLPFTDVIRRSMRTSWKSHLRSEHASPKLVETACQHVVRRSRPLPKPWSAASHRW